MLSYPTADSYRVHLSKDFIYDEVIDNIKLYTENRLPFYENLIDYLNGTITEAKVPGISIPVTRSQMQNSGGLNRVYKAHTPYLEQITKEINLTFTLRYGYVNWAIMYMQAEQFINSKSDTFLPPIYLEVIDLEGIVLFNIEFKEITLNRLSDISFSNTGGIRSDKFDVQFLFNKYDMKFHLDNQLNGPKDSYTYG